MQEATDGDKKRAKLEAEEPACSDQHLTLLAIKRSLEIVTGAGERL